jgi:hypothetical protein
VIRSGDDYAIAAKAAACQNSGEMSQIAHEFRPGESPAKTMTSLQIASI